MAERKQHEALVIRTDAALATTKAAPTLATDGIPVPKDADLRRTQHVHVDKDAAAGPFDITIEVWGYRSSMFTVTEDNAKPAEIASSGKWLKIVTLTLVSASAAILESHQIEGLQDFARFATAVPVNSGTTAAATIGIGFGGFPGNRGSN